ncbi:hypothetical protein E2C01_098899 [Portunus trituberculatus]|uniref:Uncharacterized protein n=1 Tax=Portunus trituberculatus TaxID=210409 RepID=A0A5B7K2E9_PORTR|nr:hypothetical protein [Portunus trituberculatus]
MGAAVVQWKYACFGVRGVSKRTDSNLVHGPSTMAVFYLVNPSCLIESRAPWDILAPLNPPFYSTYLLCLCSAQFPSLNELP